MVLKCSRDDPGAVPHRPSEPDSSDRVRASVATPAGLPKPDMQSQSQHLNSCCAADLATASTAGFVPQQAPPSAPRMEPLLLRHSALLTSRKVDGDCVTYEGSYGVHSFVADPLTLLRNTVSTRCHAPQNRVDSKVPSTREKTYQFPPSVNALTVNRWGWKQQSGHVFPLIRQQKSPRSSAKAPDAWETEKGHKGGWHLASLGGRHSRHPFGRFAPSPSAALRAPTALAALPCPTNAARRWGAPPVTLSEASLRKASTDASRLLATGAV